MCPSSPSPRAGGGAINGDGVGGAVKKLADNLIKTAKIIDSAENLYREVSQATDVMILLRMEEADIESSACEIKSWASVCMPGLMDTHMIVGTEGYIWTKPTSCFHAYCYTTPKFTPNCDGWKRSKMVLQKEMANITTEPTELTDINTERTETTAPTDQDDSIQISEIEIGDNLAVVYGAKWYVCQVEKN